MLIVKLYQLPLKQKVEKRKKNIGEIPEKNSNTVKQQENGRPKRNRFPPCEVWRNQRLVYKYDNNGVVEKAELQEGDKVDDSQLKKILKKRDRSKNAEKKKKNDDKSVKLQDNTINFNNVKRNIEKTEVLDPNTGKTVSVYLYRPYDTLLWNLPPRQNENNATYSMTKCFSGELISFGYFDIAMGQKKKEQVSPEHNLSFSIIRGSVKLSVHKTNFRMKELDTVVVPVGNKYSILNVGKKVAKLYYTAFKTPLFEYQYFIPPADENSDED